MLTERLRRLQPAEAVILLADLAINTGFYMLIPFLSVHITQNLGMTATLAGVVLAVRMGVQQGLMVLTGPLADLVGHKRVLVAGLLVRSAGFMSFALDHSFGALLASAIVSAAGGAMFNASERAAFAAMGDGKDQSDRAALLFTVQNVGITAGPLLGALLLGVNFRWLSLVAGALYLPNALLVALFLPGHRPAAAAARPPAMVAALGRSLRSVARNRTFVIYCLLGAGFWALNGQISISLALQAVRVTGSETAVKYLLLTGSVVAIPLQYRLITLLRGRLSDLTQIAVGNACCAAAFLVLLPFPAMGGLLAATVLLTIGSMLIRPNDFQVVAAMAAPGALASYYGFSSLFQAVGGAAGQFMGGSLLDAAAATGHPWLPWLTFAGIGLAGTAALTAFQAQGQLRAAESAD